MKKKYKNKLQKKYENLSLILNEKSNYMKNLERKRNDGLKVIKEQKARLLIEDIFKINKFKRNYSFFSFNSKYDNTPINNNISQVLVYNVKPKIINNYSYQKINNAQFGKIPNINNYSKISKNNNHSIRYNYQNPRYKILEKSGKNIIMDNNNIKNKFIKNSYYKMKNF